MRRPLITKKEYRRIGQIFNWAFKSHYVIWLLGELRRHHRSDQILKELEDGNELNTAWYNGFKVYAVPRISKGEYWNIEHGLGVTECLVRFHLADPTGIIIPERKFKGRVKADLGFLYKDSELRVEFCTSDNSRRLGVVKSKISRYSSINSVILFVMDIPREDVRQIASNYSGDKFFFIDFETFKNIPLGRALQDKVYFWGEEVTSLR